MPPPRRAARRSVSSLHAGLDADHPGRPEELEGVVGVVDRGHELGECRAPKYGVVGEVEVHHIERDVLHEEVVPSAEPDGKLDLP